MRNLIRGLALVALTCLCTGLPAAQAQILIWNLPSDDGAWIRFEGTYKQTQARPESNAGDEVLEWRSELMISSVGRTEAMFEGEKVACRWVEFKTVTKANDLDKQPGPGGVYLYKVLIPEHAVSGKTVDGEGLPVTYLPIVKGYRKVGARDVVAVSERALAVYPTIAPVTYYPDLKEVDGAATEISLPLSSEAIPVRELKGSRVFQGNRNRSTNVATLWLSDKVPFGLAKFKVELTREEKGLAASADEFRRTSLVEIEMSPVAQGTDAKSELPESN